MSKLAYVTDKYTPLMIAAEEGNLSRVRQCIGKSKINQKNQSGHSALALAVKVGASQVAEYLISQGADIHSKNNSGQSVLFFACWYNHESLVRSLINAKANINDADIRGWTPLMISVYHNYKNVAKLLMDAGADTSIKDSFGKSPIERCTNPEILALLKSSKKVKTLKKEETKTKSMKIIAPSPFAGVQYTPVSRDHMQTVKKNRDFENILVESLCSSAESSMKKVQTQFDKQIQPIYELMSNQAHQVLTEKIEEMYYQVGTALIEKLEQSCIDKGLKIPDFELPVPIVKTKPLKLPPKLAKVTVESFYDKVNEMPQINISSLSKKYNEGDEEMLTTQVDRQIKILLNKLNLISDDQIETDVSHRLTQLTQHVLEEINSEYLSLTQQLTQDLKQVLDKRYQAILNANAKEQPFVLPKLNLDAINNLDS